MALANSKLREMLKRHEGLRLKTYLCPTGRITIGYGRNVEDLGITEMEANILLSNDIARVLQECTSAFAWFNSISVDRQDVVASMCFQLGMTRLKTFKKMIAALSAQNYGLAGVEMLKSAWAKQTPLRAQELARMMNTGRYPD